MQPQTHIPTAEHVDWFVDRLSAVVSNIELVIQGKRDAVGLVITGLIAGGHVLVEDVPGVGKTLLAKSLARSIDCSFRRIQFTPDLLPSDITGVSVWDRQGSDFVFKPGAIFANIVVGDEINRASPKTQAALLEAMEERQVTVDGVTRELAPPFMVIATQNPLEHEGTYPLPEAQLDRFMMRISIGYPSREKELEMLDTHGVRSTFDALEPVVTAEEVLAMQQRRRRHPRGAFGQVLHSRHRRDDQVARRSAPRGIAPLRPVPPAGGAGAGCHSPAGST